MFVTFWQDTRIDGQHKAASGCAVASSVYPASWAFDEGIELAGWKHRQGDLGSAGKFWEFLDYGEKFQLTGLDKKLVVSDANWRNVRSNQCWIQVSKYVSMSSQSMSKYLMLTLLIHKTSFMTQVAG
jgi:hypothetical protein